MLALVAIASRRLRPALLAMLPRRTLAATPGVCLAGDCAAEAAAATMEATVERRKALLAMADGKEINARIYTPPGDAAAVIVYAHGGAFSAGSCESNAEMARTLSEATRSVVVDSSFRQGKAHPHPAALRDLEDVTRRARDLYPNLPVGVAGSSSGGFFALALAQQPPDGRPYAFCVALTPVAHPGRRRDYLQRCINGTAAQAGFPLYHNAITAQAILSLQNGYWPSDAEADAAGDALGPSSHGTPVFVVVGGRDLNVPLRVMDAILPWVDRAVVVGKYGHELCDRAPEGEDSYLPELSRFVMAALAKA